MPFINLKVTGTPTPEQKAQIVREFTDTLVRVLDKDPKTTHIVIDEVGDENWGFDGVLTTEYRKRQTKD
ncbi:MAG: 4-oxalocrotonate tautomerase family protein [Phycisphaerales bacterium]